MKARFALLLALTSCVSVPPEQPPATTAAAAPVAKALDADTPMKSRSGAVFEAPKGWFLRQEGDVVTLQAPERDLTLTFLEIKEEDAAKAIEQAWKRITPGFSLKAAHVTTPPAKDGWDAVTQIVYQTGGNEHRTVIGAALKKGAVQYITLVDGDNGALDRRGAQMMSILSTFKAPGVTEESFKGHKLRPLDAAKLEAFMESAMAKAKVPGAAIAIVHGQKVIYEKGFGVRELGKNEPVTPETLFMIGSTTKSLTTLMMARLVDEGKFSWDTPVTQVLPSFALGDPQITKRVTMKHTVCACAGLPRQDMEFSFEFAGVTPEQRLGSMKTMKPTTGFGETFQYSNTMVAAGGYAAAHALGGKEPLGPAYDQAMQSRVFDPLGMKSTTMDFAAVERREHASPHAENLRSEMKPLSLGPEQFVVSLRPAGAAWSNVRDMSKYVALELAKGKDPSGRALVSEANLAKRREPQIRITDKMAYGLGLFVEDDHGLAVDHHGGNTFGFTSDMLFLPEHDLGIVVLSNAGGAGAFRKAVRRRLFEILFGASERADRDLGFSLTEKKKVIEKELAQVVLEPEVGWMSPLAGTYESASLGSIAVRIDGKRGVVDAGEWASAFGRKTLPDGTVKLILLDPPLAGLEFLPVDRAGRKGLTLDAGQQRYGFEMSASGGRPSPR